MKRCKMSDVPKDYRRDYKKEAIQMLQMAAMSFAFVSFFAWIIVSF